LNGVSVFSKQSYAYKAVGNCQIQADVYRTPDEAVRPAILWLHGGALMMGNRATLAPDQLARYVGAGYTVIAVDYRLAPEVKLEAIIEDLQDAYSWVRQNGPDLFQIDPERIAVVGHSAGGYLALMTGACVRPRPRALVSFYGYGDIAGHWYSRADAFYAQQPAVPTEGAYQLVGGPILTGTAFEGAQFRYRYRFYVFCRQQGLWPKEVTGHDPDAEAEWFTPFCPLRNVTPDYSPTLLLHGDQDTDVPLQQSVLMSKELERNHVPHELMILPSRGHGFDSEGAGMKNPAIAKVFDHVLEFLETQGMQAPTTPHLGKATR
jgi:acetyl esterase/lipase